MESVGGPVSLQELGLAIRQSHPAQSRRIRK
jgi:hypothetical protein